MGAISYGNSPKGLLLTRLYDIEMSIQWNDSLTFAEYCKLDRERQEVKAQLERVRG